MYYLKKCPDICPNIIHHTGDIQIPNSSINILTEFIQSFETNNTTHNINDYKYKYKTEFSHETLSNTSDNVIYSDIVANAQ